MQSFSIHICNPVVSVIDGLTMGDGIEIGVEDVLNILLRADVSDGSERLHIEFCITLRCEGDRVKFIGGEGLIHLRQASLSRLCRRELADASYGVSYVLLDAWRTKQFGLYFTALGYTEAIRRLIFSMRWENLSSMACVAKNRRGCSAEPIFSGAVAAFSLKLAVRIDSLALVPPRMMP